MKKQEYDYKPLIHTKSGVRMYFDNDDKEVKKMYVPTRDRHYWTFLEISKLTKEYLDGIPLRHISRLHRRTLSEIMIMIETLKLEDKKNESIEINGKDFGRLFDLAKKRIDAKINMDVILA